MKRFYSLIDRFSSLLFVPVCGVCKERLEFDTPIFCPICRSKWESGKMKKCRFCSKAVSICTCLNNHMQMYDIDKLIKLGKYNAQNQGDIFCKVVFRLKEAHNRRLNRFLASELATAIKKVCNEDFSSAGTFTPENTIITFVPRRDAAVRKFGYDQARVLARFLASEMSLHFQPLFVATEYAKEQKKLSAHERVKNAEVSFSTLDCADMTGLNVIIVDDVTTTGATLGKCAQLANIIGAEKIFGVVVAAGGL